MDTYIIYAHTTDCGWSFEDEEPALLTAGIYGSLRDSGLAYTFLARDDEDAKKKAKEFIFYFSQEYVGEENITETYKDD